MEKAFKGYLLLNWRNLQVSYRKRKPRSLNPNIIPVKVDIKVTIPEPKEASLVGNLTVSDAQLKDMVVDAIEYGN